MKHFFIQLTEMIILILFSIPAFAHAGSHENKNCFIAISGDTLRFSGYQFQGLHPDQSYCRIFPDLGSIIIKIEPVNNELSNKKVSLQLLKLNSSINWIFNLGNTFSILKQTPLQNFNNDVNMIQTNVQYPGIYALKIGLQINDNETLYENYLFLVGIPITKILVIFSGGILWLLAFITLKTWTSKD